MPYWDGKVVVVTGASAGLGRHVSTAFAQAGATVAMVARGSQRLEAAAAEISNSGGRAIAVAADVTRDEEVERLFGRAVEASGRLDALVNCVGVSSRGRAIDTTPEDFMRSLDANFFSAVRCTRAAVPHLLKARGHLVNIGSLSGKTATRYLGAYPASKFALTAYTQQLRLELEPEGLHVLLVVPGPIARHDAGRRYAAQASNLPESAGLPGGGAKLEGIDPDKLAGRVLKACQRRRPELVVPRRARILFAIQQLWPRAGDWIVRRMT